MAADRSAIEWTESTWNPVTGCSKVLTKRAERLAELAPSINWPPNVWIGVSVENNRWTHRADYLREVPATVRFISAEPLLGPLDQLELDGIDWLIAGGESGPRHRPI